MADWITIANDRLTAAINPFGAELSSLKDAAGRELMTDADPAFWTGRAPILFPVIGATNGGVIRLDGREYPMPKHGFARHSLFTISEQHEDWLVLSLDANTETRRAYPFEFSLRLMFRLDQATLRIEAQISNSDRQRALPAQFGFHPAFAWPLPYGADRADHAVTFDGDEPEPLRLLAADGTVSPVERQSPVRGRTLALADALFEQDALIWDAVRSRGVTYGPPSGPRLRVAFPDTPSLGVWTKPGAHYICIEPWHGLADPEGYAGEFRDKPGVFTIPPGGEKRIGMSVTLVG